MSANVVDHHDVQVGRSPVQALIKYERYKTGQVCRQANEWAQRNGIRREDDWDAVRLTGQVPAGAAARLVELE